MTMLLLLQVLQVDWWTVSRCKSSYAQSTISHWRLAISCELLWGDLARAGGPRVQKQHLP